MLLQLSNYERKTPSPSTYKIPRREQEPGQYQLDPNRNQGIRGIGEKVWYDSLRADRTDRARRANYLTKSGQAGGTIGQLIGIYSQELETKLAEVSRLQQKLQELEAIQESLNAEDKSA